MTGLPSLIARLEGATEGSRELDLAIQKWWDHPVDVGDFAQNWTISLDAALTLVPEGWRIDLFQSDDGQWWDCFAAPFDSVISNVVETDSGVPTPAIAVCLAALKARLAALEKGEGK